ncbi:MAG: cysteine synthase A [Caldisericaceae bacterium]|nr:cysteine synthase A [Caldisericaceae bacterium]
MHKTILDSIGNTPIIQLKNTPDIFLKLEFLNPMGSVKDRIALFMIRDALQKNFIRPGSTIVEPTSGNTGIGLAFVGRFYDLNVILTMPDSMSIERQKIMSALGAKLFLTEKSEGMAGAIEKANEFAEEGALMLDQFKNPANALAHEMTTAPEIFEEMRCKIDAFVAGVGTGGTITGVGRALKKFDKNIKIVAMEPKQSAVLSGEKPHPHIIEGIGAGFVPDLLDRSILDEIITIDQEDAREETRRLAREEGIFAGISTGANVLAAKIILKRYNLKRVVTIAPDRGERYFSKELF